MGFQLGFGIGVNGQNSGFIGRPKIPIGMHELTIPTAQISLTGRNYSAQVQCCWGLAMF